MADDFNLLEMFSEQFSGDYLLLSYETHDSENPSRISYTGDLNGAIGRAKEEGAFEVDVFYKMSDPVAICYVMGGSKVIYV